MTDAPLMSDPPLVLSSSSVSTWLACGEKYLLQSVYRIADEPSVAATIGTAVHAGVESYLRGRGEPEIEAAAAFDREVQRMIEPEEDIPTARRDAVRMLERYIAAADAASYKPDLIEQPFLITVNGIAFSGVIDNADLDLHDIKTRAGKTINGKKPSQFRPGYYVSQLSGYVLGYQHLTGRRPRKILIDLLDRKPSYKQVEIEPDINEFVDTLELVADNIERGNYPVSGPANGACRYCEVSRICEYAVID